MSIFQPDLLFYTALKVGLADIRKSTFLMEDAYSNLLTDPYMKKMYGEKELERFKSFIAKEIMIFTEFRVPDTAKFPCIVIKIGGGEEDAAKDALGDSYQSEKVDPATLGGAFPIDHTLLGPVTPESFDPLTGVMTFGNNVDLLKSNIFDTQFVIDTKNNQSYPITLVLDSSNLLIEPLTPGQKPNFTNMVIQNSPNSYANIRRFIWVHETHSLEMMASDATELLYLFTIVMYILGRYKKQLWDARNFAVATLSYSPIYRISGEADPNNVYGREITIRGRVEQSWIESTAPLLGGMNLELKIADMTSPASLPNQAENNLWEGEGDN
jgi:hypothetical protein